GEHGEVVPRGLGVGVCDLEQDRAVALDDQGAIGHSEPVYARHMTLGPERRSRTAGAVLAAEASYGRRTEAIDRIGNVRSTSAPRSRPRRRPPPSPVASRVNSRVE